MKGQAGNFRCPILCQTHEHSNLTGELRAQFPYSIRRGTGILDRFCHSTVTYPYNTRYVVASKRFFDEREE